MTSAPTGRAASCAVKFVFDRVAALLLLVLASPVLVAAALAVWLEDRGPVFYRQERVGFRGEVFRIWKLRTMVTGADRMVEELMAANDGHGRLLFKKRNDPRVTRVGRLLRRTSIDELPQLINVLVGQMSLVGPRPLPGNDIGEYSDTARQRFQVRPGITGLWQVSGRTQGNWQDTIDFDLRYVACWSLWLDLKILLLTLPAVIGAPGGL